jgi:hypothetical protein
MIRVNLLSGVARSSTNSSVLRTRSLSAAICLVLMTAAGFGLWLWTLNREIAVADTRIARTESDLAGLKRTAQFAERVKARKTVLSSRLLVVNQLRVAQHGAFDLLAAVGQCLTDGLWIVALEEKNGLVQIEGRALAAPAVTDFVSRLQATGPFDRPFEIVMTSGDPLDGTPVIRFVARSYRRDGRAAPLSGSGAGVPAERR